MLTLSPILLLVPSVSLFVHPVGAAPRGWEWYGVSTEGQDTTITRGAETVTGREMRVTAVRSLYLRLTLSLFLPRNTLYSPSAHYALRAGRSPVGRERRGEDGEFGGAA